MLLCYLAAGTVILAACIADLRTGKIPNAWTLPAMGFGLLLQIFTAGFTGLVDGICGVVLPVAILFVLFVKGVLGAGDVKLFSAVGSLIGHRIVVVMVDTFVVTAVYGSVLLLAHACAGVRMKHRVHMSLPIAFGYGVYVLGSLMGW